MQVMTKHTSHRAAFKRQIAEEFVASETLHTLAHWHNISRQLIRILVGKSESSSGKELNHLNRM
jgi:hypothetical protein